DRVGDVHDIPDRFSVRGNETDGVDGELVRDFCTGHGFGFSSVDGDPIERAQTGLVDVVHPLSVRRTDGMSVEESESQLFGGGAICTGAPDGDGGSTAMEQPVEQHITAGTRGKTYKGGVGVAYNEGGVMTVWIHPSDAGGVGDQQFSIRSPVEQPRIGDLG